MKRIPLLLCAAVLAVTPVATQAVAQASDGLNVSLGVGLLMGQQDDDRRHRHRDDNNNGEHRGDERRDNGDERYGGPPPRAAYGGDEDRRDDRIGRAMAIGRSQGNVINAWPQGGSLFLVRVNTSHGRVDLVVDVDSGRIVGER